MTRNNEISYPGPDISEPMEKEYLNVITSDDELAGEASLSTSQSIMQQTPGHHVGPLQSFPNVTKSPFLNRPKRNKSITSLELGIRTHHHRTSKFNKNSNLSLTMCILYHLIGFTIINEFLLHYSLISKFMNQPQSKVLLIDASQIELRLPPRLTNQSISGNSPDSYDISYLIEYEPSRGIPSSRFKLTPSDIKTNANVIIADTKPGANYTINVFPIYGNETMGPLIWSTIYSTEPGPPRELSVDVITGKEVKLDWSPPSEGAVSNYQAKIIPLSDQDEAEVKNLTVTHNELTLKLRDLTPGATYEVQLQSVYAKKPSNVFLSANFTTKPNTPGRFIVWFRNETTLLVLWNPPFPSGIFDKYRVNILPPDSGVHSELEIDREEGSKSAQAAFYGLVPGRNYNISVQTVSHDQYSQPVEAQYRTVPLPPSNITQDKSIVSSSFIEVRWSPPKHTTEFDRYQLSLGTVKSSGPKIVPKDEERVARFDENLEPGRTYEVVVKTVSGNVASWPISSNITTAPLPVTDIKSTHGKAGEMFLEWAPNNQSIQDSYIIKYHEVEAFNSDGTVQVVQGKNSTHLVNLLAGRNFSITVFAVSHEVSSEPTVTFGVTRPATPIVESKQIQQGIGERALNISWRWDVTSKQDSYRINLSRNDTRQRKEFMTRDNSYILENLYPGATYNINVSAISFNLISEPYSFYQTINPRPPEKVEISRVTNSSLSLSWIASQNSIIDHYAVKYKTIDSHFWRDVQPIESTFAELKDLDAGERYLIKVVSLSNKMESIESREVEQTMYPNSIMDIKHVLDSYNLTFQWSIPSGRVDYYLIVYNSIREPTIQQTKQISINNARTGQLVTAIIDLLQPGELYSFMLYGVSYNLRSEGIGLQLRTLPVIASSVQVVIDEHATKTLGIKYSPTLPKYVVFDRYRFQISEPSAPIQERMQNDTNRLVLFDNLTPGKLYNISVWTVSGGMFSAPITRQARLYPEPVRSISSVSVSDIEITLVWETPFGDNDAFEVQYLDHRDKHLRSNITFAEKITFTNLRPHSNYTFIVTVLSGYGTSTVLRSSPTSQTFSTLESTPGKVKSFHAIDVKPHEITLKWSLPSSDQNGVLTGYKISYYYKGSSLLKNEYFPPIQSNGTITGLIPGKQYVFQIQAHTKVGGGSKALWEETMPIWAPPQPEANHLATESGHSSTTIKARFKKSLFSNIYGPVIAYTIIVSEDTSKPSDYLDLPSWFDVQPYATWPPYQTVEPFYPINSSVIEEFVIGSANCFNGRSNDKLYCNGPLKSGTSYKVKIRAFTAHDKFTDTKWSLAMTTDADNTAMFVGIFLPLALLTLLVITILFMKQRKLGPFTKGAGANGVVGHKSNLRKSLQCGTLNSAFKDDPISIDIREMNTSRPVDLKNFAKHFREMSADSDFRFSEEFDQLKYIGTDKTVKAADLPSNRPKNRFTNIVPYDHSRVKLSPTDDEEGSDYINANYIPGYNSPREFIVTQGPLYGTQDDFWRMLWEQNSRAIVMLTRCIEKGREKCIQYWPSDDHPVIYGDIQVIMLNECQYTDWTVTELKVSRNDSSRIVRHFHFTTWPDFGVPEPPSTLVKFVRAFREKVHPSGNHPIIAHCSAGVGRSGTFIALDRILQIIRTKDVVDIFGIVCEMRRERCHMVQNEQQYICIHQCLLWALEGGEGEMSNSGNMTLGGKRQSDLHSHGLIGLSAESGI